MHPADASTKRRIRPTLPQQHRQSAVDNCGDGVSDRRQDMPTKRMALSNGDTAAVTATSATTTMNPILEKIAAYLRDHSNTDTIDPAGIASELLPHIYILAIEPTEQARYLRVRLTGTGIDASLDRSVRGKYMEDFLHGSHSSDVLDGFHACARTGTAIWMRQVVRIADRVPRYVEGVAFRIGMTRIYGGLLFGEVSNHESDRSFERRLL